jgi:hypothetical protein
MNAGLEMQCTMPLSIPMSCDIGLIDFFTFFGSYILKTKVMPLIGIEKICANNMIELRHILANR